jgi:hypothetical protein
MWSLFCNLASIVRNMQAHMQVCTYEMMYMVNGSMAIGYCLNSIARSPFATRRFDG